MEEQAVFLEKSTDGQSSSCLWYDHRVGRITASRFGSIAKCALRTYTTSLVKSIMQYTSPSPRGRSNEDTARKQYAKLMEADHLNFSVVST